MDSFFPVFESLFQLHLGIFYAIRVFLIQAFSDSPQQGFVMIIHRAIQHHRDLSGMTQVFPTASLFHVAQPQEIWEPKTGDFDRRKSLQNLGETLKILCHCSSSFIIPLYFYGISMVLLWDSLRSIPSHSMYPRKTSAWIQKNAGRRLSEGRNSRLLLDLSLPAQCRPRRPPICHRP